MTSSKPLKNSGLAICPSCSELIVLQEGECDCGAVIFIDHDGEPVALLGPILLNWTEMYGAHPEGLLHLG